MHELTWTATICTYNREYYLLECVNHLSNQTRHPDQVVIIDASDYWEQTYNQILHRFRDLWMKVNLVYEPAEVRSLTLQRNQALEKSESEIIFSLDDDIYLYPDAAEIIMNAYEKDNLERVAMIGGLFADTHPLELSCKFSSANTAPKKNILTQTPIKILTSIIRDYFETNLSLDKHFVPYSHAQVNSHLYPELSTLNVNPGGLINGGRTTFRKRYADSVKWSTFLRYYAANEDCDFSYRMSYKGDLLIAKDALFYHADGNEHEMNRYREDLIRVLNLLALHRVYSTSRLTSLVRLSRSFVFFIFLYLFIDPVRKRLTLPVVRANLSGLFLVPLFMFFPFRNFKGWYIKLQRKMYGER